MEILCVEAGLFNTNCYFIICDNKKNTLLVDCALNSADSLFEIIKQRQLLIDGIILTHTHWDHSGDASAMKELTGAPVMVHPDDEYRLLKPNESTVMPLGFDIVALKPDRYLNHGEKIMLVNHEFEIRHTPGHTEGSISIINHKDKIVFSGDALFNGSIGRTDFPGGSFETLMNSINEQLLTLDDEYIVYSGHGLPTTIGQERVFNPFINSNYV